MTDERAYGIRILLSVFITYALATAASLHWWVTWPWVWLFLGLFATTEIVAAIRRR